MAVTLPSVYQDGTATIAANGAVVTGQGTLWTNAILPGDFFGVHKGYAVRVLSVDSDTQLTLANNWPGAAQTAAHYEIMLQSDIARMQETSRQLLQQLSNGNIAAFTGLTGAANSIPIFTGPGAMSLIQTGTSGAKIPLLNGANTWATTQTFGDGTANSAIVMNSPGGSANIFRGQKAGILAWQVLFGDNNAMAGGNVGADFQISRYSDAGVSLGTALYISRATGLATIPGGISSGNIALSSNAALSFAGTGAATTRVNLGVDYATTAEAQAGAVTTKVMSPKTTLDEITALGVLKASPAMSAPPIITTAQVGQDGVINAAWISGIDLTGTSDTSAKLQVALDAIAARSGGGALEFPAGSKLRVNTQLNFTADVPLAIRSNGGRRGAKFGQYSATLFNLSDAAAGSDTGSNMALDIDGIQITCEVAAATAFKISNPESVRMTRIRAASGAGYWSKFVDGQNIRTSFFEDWYARNDHGLGTAADIQGTGFSLGSTAGSTDNKYVGILLQGFNAAWNSTTSTSPAVEGQHFFGCSWVQCNYGFVWSNTHATYIPPLLHWVNGHMNCYKQWGNFSKVAQLDFSHSTFELNSAFGDALDGFSMTNVDGFNIGDNKMYFTNGNRNVAAVVVASGTKGGNIHDNYGTLTGGGNAIYMLGGSSNNTAHDNGFYGAAAAVLNGGTGNIVGVNNRILT